MNFDDILNNEGKSFIFDLYGQNINNYLQIEPLNRDL